MIQTKYQDLRLIFGGTFNPIHYGHLNALLQTADQLPTKEIIIVPCGIPPHKVHSNYNNQHQYNMLNIALKSAPLFPYPVQIEQYELQKKTPSYTIETLSYLSQKYPKSEPLVLIIGMDSYLNFTSWHQWEEILTIAHLAIIPRPNYNKKELTEPKLLNLETNNYQELLQTNSGKIWISRPNIHLDISATRLRIQIKNKKNPLFLLDGEGMSNLIMTN